MDAPSTDPKPAALVAIALTATISGSLLGAVTNAINSQISPEYFVAILHWKDVQDVGRAAIAQGIFEGLIYGAVFSLVYALVLGIASRARVTFGFAVRRLALAALIASVCWCLGGLAAVGLAALSPEFYRHAFRGVPEEFGAMLRFAWVGGSIWGVMFGGVLAMVIAPLRAATEWRRRLA